MATKTVDENVSKLDPLKWLVALLLVAVAVVGNSFYGEQPLLYRVIGVLVLALVAAGISLQTAPGKAFQQLLKDARMEIRKVVWPTGAETRQTTLVVVAVVAVMALLLWLVDWALGTVVSSIIG